MKKVAVHIQKGGVGKTTLSGNVAWYLALDRKVVLVDGDPQGNATSWFLTEKPKHELADVLKGDVSLDDVLVQLTENLYFVPIKRVEELCRDNSLSRAIHF